MAYPRDELRAAFRAACYESPTGRLGVPDPDVNYTEAVVWLERRGYLPRDVERVERIVAEATAAARAYMQARAAEAQHAAAIDDGVVVELATRRRRRRPGARDVHDVG